MSINITIPYELHGLFVWKAWSQNVSWNVDHLLMDCNMDWKYWQYFQNSLFPREAERLHLHTSLRIFHNHLFAFKVFLLGDETIKASLRWYGSIKFAKGQQSLSNETLEAPIWRNVADIWLRKKLNLLVLVLSLFNKNSVRITEKEITNLVTCFTRIRKRCIVQRSTVRFFLHFRSATMGTTLHGTTLHNYLYASQLCFVAII